MLLHVGDNLVDFGFIAIEYILVGKESVWGFAGVDALLARSYERLQNWSTR